jgi:hypothetical protein
MHEPGTYNEDSVGDLLVIDGEKSMCARSPCNNTCARMRDRPHPEAHAAARLDGPACDPASPTVCCRLVGAASSLSSKRTFLLVKRPGYSQAWCALGIATNFVLEPGFLCPHFLDSRSLSLRISRHTIGKIGRLVFQTHFL